FVNFCRYVMSIIINRTSNLCFHKSMLLLTNKDCSTTFLHLSMLKCLFLTLPFFMLGHPVMQGLQKQLGQDSSFKGHDSCQARAPMETNGCCTCKQTHLSPGGYSQSRTFIKDIWKNGLKVVEPGFLKQNFQQLKTLRWMVEFRLTPSLTKGVGPSHVTCCGKLMKQTPSPSNSSFDFCVPTKILQSLN
uniref:Uncharacterized protein n=1 Tax=Apteryx owenii TaxID=8824 RepID=A0A8B9Q0C5_APTOW